MSEFMLVINLTEIESDIKNGKIVTRDLGFYKPLGDGTIESIMQSEICHKYFGIEHCGKTRYCEDGKKIIYGCSKEEDLIWPAGAGCKGSWGTCPIFEKLEILFDKYDKGWCILRNVL